MRDLVKVIALLAAYYGGLLLVISLRWPPRGADWLAVAVVAVGPFAIVLARGLATAISGIRGLQCWTGNHRVRLVEEFSPVFRKIKCVDCGRVMAMHDNVQHILEWDDELDGLAAMYHEIHRYGVRE